MNELWDRQKEETSKNYEYFCCYRDLPYTSGGGRSIAKVADQFKKVHRHMERICSKHSWVERVAAYDEYIDKLVRSKQEDEIVAMRAKHANIAEDMIKKALDALEMLETGNFKPHMVTNMLKTAVEIERISRGEATEISRVDGEIGGIQIYIPDNKR